MKDSPSELKKLLATLKYYSLTLDLSFTLMLAVMSKRQSEFLGFHTNIVWSWLNLVQECLEDTSGITTKIKNLISYFHHSYTAFAQLRDIQQKDNRENEFSDVIYGNHENKFYYLI
jgi:hypothetical protein